MDLSKLGFKILNPTMNKLLRSPLHFIVSKRLMAIEYTGVKSGKKFSVPVSYFKKDAYIYCLTDGKWWNNFKSEQDVTLILQSKSITSSAIALTDDKETFIDVLSSLLNKFPSDARYYGVKLGADNKPLSGELDRALENNVMVKFSTIA
ncbi:MAG: hypothetical protein HRU20_13970 [Pseudomonadales bacterium]|nr:hypothetical protein [Pseudomonadales bacterium]